MDATLLAALIPLLFIELALKLVCFFDWRRRDTLGARARTIWLLVFLFVSTLGPIAYLVKVRRS
ncbi:MAG: PLDc N-terminal domain-containing protein [Spirochaetaceae bacterium]